MNLLKRVQNTSYTHNLWTKNSKIVVGVSGGPDSVCLLNIFLSLKDKYALKLVIAHVNYGLRGKESDRDEEIVRKFTQENSLKLEVLRPKISQKSNLESHLRTIRYDFFEKVRMHHKFGLIAVAHNQDDQVETFFLRILRGSGLKGLGAMKFKNEKIIRPLLNISRKDILAYLKENKLNYGTDKTNKENIFTRNKIRNKLIPYLEKNFNSQIKQIIFNSTLSLAQDFTFLEEATPKNYSKKSEIDIKDFLKLHPALQRRVLLKAIEEKRGDLKGIDSSHIAEIMKIIASPKGKSQVFLFKGLKLQRKGAKIILS